MKKHRDAFANECERIRTCGYVYTHVVRSGGNGSARIRVRICFAPEQIVADTQKRETCFIRIIFSDRNERHLIA